MSGEHEAANSAIATISTWSIQCVRVEQSLIALTTMDRPISAQQAHPTPLSGNRPANTLRPPVTSDIIASAAPVWRRKRDRVSNSATRCYICALTVDCRKHVIMPCHAALSVEKFRTLCPARGVGKRPNRPTPPCGRDSEPPPDRELRSRSRRRLRPAIALWRARSAAKHPFPVSVSGAQSLIVCTGRAMMQPARDGKGGDKRTCPDSGRTGWRSSSR